MVRKYSAYSRRMGGFGLLTLRAHSCSLTGRETHTRSRGSEARAFKNTQYTPPSRSFALCSCASMLWLTVQAWPRLPHCMFERARARLQCLHAADLLWGGENNESPISRHLPTIYMLRLDSIRLYAAGGAAAARLPMCYDGRCRYCCCCCRTSYEYVYARAAVPSVFSCSSAVEYRDFSAPPWP